MQLDQLKRREFIILVGGAAAAWPLAARAQQAGKLPTIGFLGTSTSLAMNRWVTAFVQRLRELGWIEGRSVAIEYRFVYRRAANQAASHALVGRSRRGSGEGALWQVSARRAPTPGGSGRLCDPRLA
jgi:hypothetical protein